ncbi:MAG: KilA-N domain-containing protein [Clostridia bacterium]|nr:KilA-N domain-containing protein [Clostridia bacterium]
MNMNDMLKNFSENDLKDINNFLNSAQGKNLVSNINKSQKEKILQQFMQLDPNTVKRKLNGLSKEDILKLLK